MPLILVQRDLALLTVLHTFVSAFAVANEQSHQADSVQTVCLGTVGHDDSPRYSMSSTITLLMPW